MSTTANPTPVIDGEAVEQPPGDEAGAELAVVAAAPGGAIIRAERPEEIIEKATSIANSLKDLIEAQGLAADVGGKSKHVEVGGWQALGFLLGALGGQALHAETVWTRPVTQADGTHRRTAYTATVRRYHSKKNGGGLREEVTYDVDGLDWEACVEIRTADGTVVGRAEAMCGRAEERWGKAADYAVRSMAETRAESRAYRRAAGWLVKIAGYSPTPAEEVPPAEAEPAEAELAYAGDLEELAGWLQVGMPPETARKVIEWCVQDGGGTLGVRAGRALGAAAKAIYTAAHEGAPGPASDPAEDPPEAIAAAAAPAGIPVTPPDPEGQEKARAAALDAAVAAWGAEPVDENGEPRDMLLVLANFLGHHETDTMPIRECEAAEAIAAAAQSSGCPAGETLKILREIAAAKDAPQPHRVSAAQRPEAAIAALTNWIAF